MKKYEVIAYVYYGGIYSVKHYKTYKKAKAEVKTLNSSPDMYTWFEIKENKDEL